MGSFSWTRAEATTKRSNLTCGDKYKILVPKKFGGGYILDKYHDYGHIGEETNGDYLYVDGNGEKHSMCVDKFGHNPDLYGILAYWNGCNDLVWEGIRYPNTMLEILKHGLTYEQSNRVKGIGIGCYNNQIDELKFPLKLVSVSYDGTYEDCPGRSYGDPNQGFTRGYWNQRDYQKYHELLKSVEKQQENPPSPSKLYFSKRLRISSMYSKWLEDNSTDTYRVEDCPLSVVSFLSTMGWLNEEKILEDLKRDPE